MDAKRHENEPQYSQTSKKASRETQNINRALDFFVQKNIGIYYRMNKDEGVVSVIYISLSVINRLEFIRS